MTNLVIFGDSFTENDFEKAVPEQSKIEYDSYHNNWTNQLANKLSVNEINYGMGGTSIEYSLTKFYDYIRDNDVSNDICIFALTSPQRQYWGDFYKRKTFTDFDFDIDDSIDDNILHWVIDNEQMSKMEARWINATCMLHNFAYLFKKMIILNCFSTDIVMQDLYRYIKPNNEVLVVKGSLRKHISSNEYIHEEPLWDPRPNHISDANHKILADEIYNAIVNDTELDLTNILFVKDIYAERVQ